MDSQKDYVAAAGEVSGNTYYLTKTAAERLGLKVERTIKGQELVGLNYLSPFDHLPCVQKAMDGQPHKVIATDNQILPISDEEGTGLVHIAPGAGSEDFQFGKKIGLPVIDVIDESAVYLEDLADFSGKNAKDHPEIILDFIKEKDGGKYFFSLLKYKHRYPACWRCQSELVWRVVDEWYISMDPLREPMKEVAKKMKWLPEFGLKRELDWLDNMHDWLISKKRYWGLALPIWECEKCGDFQVIGGEEELKEKAAEGWDKFEGNSPHRPFIDEVKIKCTKCDGLCSRIPDVGNPWLDAGIVPFSTMPKDWFPADFITESFPGQFKNWFYSLIAMSTVLENEAPVKTILGFATLLAEDGRPMHKSWGNSIEFNEGADKIGVDVMRWMYAKQDPASNMLFGYKAGEQTKRQFLLMLWNIYNFFITYAITDDWSAENTNDKSKSVLDKWILAKLNETGLTATKSLEEYDGRTASTAIEEFVQDFSLWYVRRSRDRVGPNALDAKDKEACFTTFHSVLVKLSQLLAPFMPFVSEEMYKNLTGEKSVHLSDWPSFDPLNKNDKALIEKMSLVRKIVERGHAGRKETNIPVRQPLASIKVKVQVEKLDDELLQLIKQELNIKNVEWDNSGTIEPSVELDTVLTPELEEEGKTRELARAIQDERKKLGTPLDAKINVVAKWLPENPELLDWLKKRTLAESLIVGDDLRVEQC